ncbi:MAG TPA: quinol:electron acceptor oxidoreductase subunit ActD [Anaeromyxobacteraceae bacterium]|nr:quinol:electron acceptor oxidoreductase subunit ActD [Anaeromyxobacteraceae bacterium]
MSPDPGVLAAFAEPHDAARAIRALREGGFDDVRAAMPAPYPEVLAAVGKPRSFMAFASLPGAAVGVCAGLALTIGTSLAWQLVTGGKPVVSMPPFVVISFELAILAGAISTLGALVGAGAWGGRRREFPRDPRFAVAGVGVYAAGGDPERAAEILRACGAVEVDDVQ